ncbi:MAG: LamB/YcsF family protein [Massiliimalia sp.]
MLKIDLNCDLGESFGNYTIGMDEEVIPFISSANIACGWHASDPVIMGKTVKKAKEFGVAVGAHPGFLDLMGFGRRNMTITPQEAREYVTYQVGALYAFCRREGIPLQHVKPHGALYNMAAKDRELALAICQGLRDFDPNVILLALSGSQMVTAAKEVGIPVAQEVFADRAYEDDGSLVARSKPGAVIHDPDVAIARVIRMVTEGKVTSIHGNDIDLKPDSVCVHGDNREALAFVQKIRQTLEQNDIQICPLSEIVCGGTV